jgi:enterochelin esterase family protein
VTPLEPNKPVERVLLAGETHAYDVLVPPDRVVTGTVDQRGVDVFVRIVDPSGKTIATLDSPNGPKGPEPWTIEPKPAGTWRIEVVPFGSKDTGRYEARIDGVIPALEHAERKATQRYRSPRMVQLWKEHRAEGAAAMERFAMQMAGHAPLVEPIAGDPRGDVLVTFLWRGGPETHYVGLLGGPVGPGLESPLQRFEGTDLWYLTVPAPRDLRITYSFRQGGPPDMGATRKQAMNLLLASTAPDPWNPRQSMMRSLIELPGAPAQAWAERKEGVAAGRIIEKTIKSEILGEDRKIGVYLPPKLDPAGGPYPYVTVFDGEAYGLVPDAVIPTATILDNLIAQGKVPPMLGVLVASGASRERDLPMSAPFCDFLVKELVPVLRREFHAAEAPADATLAGASFGGLAAAYCALHHPDVFGNVLSQSGSFWFSPGAMEAETPYSVETGALMREVVSAPVKPVRFWMEVGLFEGGAALTGTSQVAQNRHMRDVLLAKGYDVSYHEYSGGHDYCSWRGSLADGLIALAGKPAKP